MINPAHLPALQLAQRGTDHRLPPLIGPPTASINLLEFSIQAKASLARAAVMREEFDIELEEEMGEEWRRCQIGFGEEMVLEGEAQHDGETSKCPLLRFDDTIPVFHTRTRPNSHNNTLKNLLHTRSSVPSTPHDLLDKIKIQISFQPFSKTNVPVSHPFSVRAQTLVLLASNTLLQFQENILAGGDAIPVQLPRELDSENEDDEDEEVKEVKWSTERSNPGSCFIFDGLIYADEDEGQTNYTEMVLKAIEETDWLAPPRPVQPVLPRKTPREPPPPPPTLVRPPPLPTPSFLPPTAPRSIPHPLLATHETTLAALPLPTSVLGAHEREEKMRQARWAQRGFAKPDYRRGGNLRETLVADLGKRDGDGGIKVGMSGLYLHQGNLEHVWVVDWIRYEHPNDPPIMPVRTAAVDDLPAPDPAPPLDPIRAPVAPLPPVEAEEELPTLEALALRAVAPPPPVIAPPPAPDPAALPPPPEPLPPQPKTFYPSPYPLTTHLSKANSVLCKMCELNPAEIVVVENEMTGINPATMCRKCFKLFFGREEGEEEEEGGEKVRTVPFLTEYDVMAKGPGRI